MNELHLQDRFLIPFFRDGLGYQEVKANTVTQSLIIEEDLQAFISDTKLSRNPRKPHNISRFSIELNTS